MPMSICLVLSSQSQLNSLSFSHLDFSVLSQNFRCNQEDRQSLLLYKVGCKVFEAVFQSCSILDCVR